MTAQEPKQFQRTTGAAKRKSNHLFVISAPSGAGKTTLGRMMLEIFTDISYSISYTTRSCRNSEKDGVDYHFVTRDEFKKGIVDHKWAEWAEVHGNYYGTSAELLDRRLAEGKDILLDLDVQGTRQILERYPDSVTIFIMPPSLSVLRQRLEARGTDSADAISVRLHNAQVEMSQKAIYRHVIINDHLSDAAAELTNLIEQYRTGSLQLIFDD